MRDHHHDIILIQETKMGAEKVQKIKNRFFKDYGCQAFDSDGVFGGVANFWNPKVVSRSTLFAFDNHVATHFSCPRDKFS